MNTLKLTTEPADIARAARIIADGGLVAFPTETVYGLGADALNEAAVAAVYQAKGRPSDNPMIVHIAGVEELSRLTADESEDIRRVTEAFWPGPLTIILRKLPAVPDRTTGGLDTVAIRMPETEAARELIRLSGCPIAAPSANLSGSPSPTRARDVIADLDGRIDAVICGDDCRVGIESTVLDLTSEQPMILRPGIITAERIAAALGKDVAYDPSLKEAAKHTALDPEKGAQDSDFKPKSPGMKYRHYAPRAEMHIISGAQDRVREEIRRRQEAYEKEGRKVGVILFEEAAFAEAAHDLFSRLRDLDAAGVDVILAGALNDADGVGFAVMNRMLKSAGYSVIRV